MNEMTDQRDMQIAQYEDERRELIAALTEACEWIEGDLVDTPETCPVTREFRALLEKLK